MGEEWCREKLANLQVKDLRLNTLNEIRNHLSQISDPEPLISRNFLQSPEIFACLDGNTSEQNLACDIILICMANMNLEETNFSPLLERSLNNANPNVKNLALTEIIRILKKNPSIQSIDNNLIISVISCLDCSDTSVGTNAMNVLSQLLLIKYDDAEIKNQILTRLNSSDIIRCRIYEIGVNLSKSSPQFLDKCKIILDKMITELENEDILLQLNILELLVSLAEQNHGLVYLENQGVFEKVINRVEFIDQNPLDRILMPGFMKFFGKIAAAQPNKIILGYPHMIYCLFESLLSGDASILPTAFDTLGNLAHSSQGKILLETNYSERMKDAFEEIGAYLRNLPTELKTRAFNALEIIFRTEGVPSEQICKITKKWCQHLIGHSDLRLLLEFSKNPFPDIKTACLSVVKVLCSYQWGIKALKATGGFIEYLLDRSVEFDKDVLVAKYEINQILSESSVFDANTILQLKKYVFDGILYVEGIVEVAVDGS